MDEISKEARSKNMASIKSKDTRPELIVRRKLHKLGFRYRVHYPIVGKPDIVFPSKKIAIFVHGCFWHGHGCRNDHISKTNSKYWNSKIETNRKRDMVVKKELLNLGWQVVIIWECKIKIDHKI